jgi:hypothetical protein
VVAHACRSRRPAPVQSLAGDPQALISACVAVADGLQHVDESRPFTNT